MATAIKNPYQMDLTKAAKLKLYNQGAFWAFNIAKYRALLSNDPAVIKNFYKVGAPALCPDIHKMSELTRSFYFSDDMVNNAEEFFGIIPMICESIAKLVCGSGYEIGDCIEKEKLDRLKVILEDNEFDTETLKASVVETVGIGDGAWHVYFDAELSDYPLIEFIPAERLLIHRKGKRVTEYVVKQQVVLEGEPKPYELHTCYKKRRTQYSKGGVVRYKDDGIIQQFKIWDSGKYLENAEQLKKEVFGAYGITEEQRVIPIVDFPIIYLPNTLGNAQNSTVDNNARPYGVVFGLETVSAALDEILSNCVDTVRKAFPFLLIDESMIPSNVMGDKDEGAFSTRRHSFVAPKSAREPEKLLQFIQAELRTTEYVEAAKFQINIALNKTGINAATLGLQLSGHIEAEGTQNAKERNSIRTRNALAADYERYLSKLFAVLLQYDDYINGVEIATDNDTGDQGIVAEDYSGIQVAFRKYIVDTPEELGEVIGKKVMAGIMSIFAAVREQHPDWDDEQIYKEANLIYSEKNTGIQVVDPEKPPEASAVVSLGEHKEEGDDNKPDQGAQEGTEKGKDGDGKDNGEEVAE